MRFIYNMIKVPVMPVLGIMVLLTSCGSSQYASQNNDGIYGSGNSVEYQEEVAVQPDNSAYYQNLFKEKSMDYQMPADQQGEVFTDVDSYQGNYDDQYYAEDGYTGYAGWGQSSSNISVNVYNDSWWWGNPYWSLGWGDRKSVV